MATELLPPGAEGPGEIGEFAGAGGRRLRYRRVAPADPRRHVVYCHGIESHGTWFLPAARDLAARGCAVHLLDRRGSGLNRGRRPGEAASAAVLLEDLGRFRDHLGAPRIELVGLSWGGKLATAAALDRPEGVGSLILITPGLKARVDLGPGQKLALLAGLLTGGRNLLKVPIRPEMFTAVPRHLEFIRRDPLRLTRVSGRLLLAGIGLDRRIGKPVARLSVPTLLFLAERDRIIDNAGVRDLVRSLAGDRLRTHLYAGATHSIQFDQREQMVSHIMEFLEDPAVSP